MALDEATNPMRGVSGPGDKSKRTDLRYQPDQYGDGVAMAAQKAGAPLASTPDPRGATNTEVRQAAGAQPQVQAPSTELFAPTSRPAEPITHGINTGAGGGSEVLAMQKSSVKLSDTLAKMLPYDSDGSIAILYQNALARGN